MTDTPDIEALVAFLNGEAAVTPLTLKRKKLREAAVALERQQAVVEAAQRRRGLRLFKMPRCVEGSAVLVEFNHPRDAIAFRDALAALDAPSSEGNGP